VNLALVLYLIITKRLFGVRGGKAAYDARLRGESVLAEAQRLAAERASHPASAAAPNPASATAVTSPPADPAATPASARDPR
jgi:hypothetical protein